MKFVRILWDIENIALPKESSPSAIVQQLQMYALTQARMYKDEPFDILVSAFVCPSKFQNAHALANFVRLLDSAGIEIIAVSDKREDADRKLVARALRECRVLPPTDSVIVVVSSDKDFCALYGSMRSLGFRVVVVHCATNLEWEESLALYANVCVRWNDIIRTNRFDRLPSPDELRRVLFGDDDRVHRSIVHTRVDPAAYGYKSVSSLLADAELCGYIVPDGAWLVHNAVAHENSKDHPPRTSPMTWLEHLVAYVFPCVTE